ncbi:MAG: alpha-amylase family glycosyl hydrolase [Myxococcota bacterium]|jgi:glycosidase|nr:alpha-amylase family glycosyl hydrolase [Myxococcota bacterium]
MRSNTPVWFCWCLLGLSVVVWACEESDPPDAPCKLDCGKNGKCAIVTGAETCVCLEGYDGDGCASCADGYIKRGELCVLDPCTPNPCDKVHQGICVAQDDGYRCDCDEGAQDNDADGVCMPGCEMALRAGFEGQTCDDSSGDAVFTGLRSCDVTVRFDPGTESYNEIYIRGEFNEWEATYPLSADVDGTYFVTLSLSPGQYAYKFFVPQGERWFEDPSNPYFKYVDWQRNSRLIVPDCSQPYLRLMHRPLVEDGAIRFKVQYVDGSQGAGLAGSIEASRDDAPIQGAYDAASGVLSIEQSGLQPGKYLYRFRASDNAGRRSELLYVPVWVEEQSFDWRDAVMYFVLTDRFADGNPSNNAPSPDVDFKANWQGGDFAGLRAKLEAGYFDDLGVNAIWISSISQNTGGSGFGTDGRRYSAYHSYWPISTGWSWDQELTGVQPVDPHFGDLEEFKSLVQLAHSKGIRVLVDFVANHVHTDSPLWVAQQGANPPWFHVPAEVCEDIGWSKPIECWFANYLPDFEYRNAEVIDRVVAHALWLVQATGIDGFRLDAVKHMVDDFSFAVRAGIDRSLVFSGERFYMVGETFTGEDGVDLLKRYVNPMMLDGQFDFPLYWKLTKTLLREEEDLRALEGMTKWNDTVYGEWAIMSTFLGNHDVCRAVGQANGDFGDMWCNGGKEQGWNNPPRAPESPEPFAKLRLAWTFLFSTGGIPLIYYGDEFGMEGAGDPDNRKMMRFSGLTTPQAETLSHVQRLAAVRRAHPALSRGKRYTEFLDSNAWAYSMRDEDLGDSALVVLNRAATSRTFELDVSELDWDDGDTVRDAISEESITVSASKLSLKLEGRSSAVLTKE